MWRISRLLAAAVVTLGTGTALAGPAVADPVNSGNTFALTAECSNGDTFTFLVSPARGRAVLDTSGTSVQLTFALAVDDPLNEIGGSFTVPLDTGIPRDKLTACSGTVIGTESVTYTALVLLTPQGP